MERTPIKQPEKQVDILTGVEFRPLSSFQPKNCLFSNDCECKGTATLEAVWGNKFIRCCDSEECKKRAAISAKSIEAENN